MKKFTSFLRQKKQRIDHFTWADGDVETDTGINEWTHADPKTREKDFEEEKHIPKEGSSEHDSFMKHHYTLDAEHRKARDYYKGSSTAFNFYLRHHKHRDDGHPNDIHDEAKHFHEHDKHMSHVTSHKIEHHHTVFRGGVPKDETRFPVGHKFQDHGYTGTSFHKGIADSFDSHRAKTTGKTGHKRKDIVHVIHVPPGTKGHYLDVADDTPLSSEREMVLHRGTKFKVTHHTHTEDTHYIHSRVVGQHARKLPPIKHEDNGVIMTKHDDEKSDAIKKKLHSSHHIKITLTPAQKEFAANHAAAKADAEKEKAHKEKWKNFK